MTIRDALCALEAFRLQQSLQDALALRGYADQLALMLKRMQALETSDTVASNLFREGQQADAACAASRLAAEFANRKVEWLSKSVEARNEILKAIRDARLDRLQMILGVVAILDPTGILSLVNGTISLLRGNKLDALENFAGAIPGFGKAFLGVRGARLAANVGRALCPVVRLAGMVRDAQQIREGLASEDPLTVAFAGGDFLLRLFFGGCFSGQTPVVTGLDPNDPTKFQSQAIETLQVGQYVLSRPENDPEAPLEYKKITAVHVTTLRHLRILTLQDAQGNVFQLQATNEHPFWVPDRGWMPIILWPRPTVWRLEHAFACKKLESTYMSLLMGYFLIVSSTRARNCTPMQRSEPRIKRFTVPTREECVRVAYLQPGSRSNAR